MLLSVRDRGLLQVEGELGGPAIEPYFLVDKKRVSTNLSPGSFSITGFRELTPEFQWPRCDPNVLRTTWHPCCISAGYSHQSRQFLAVNTGVGLNASWGGLSRVTYTPVALNGERKIAGAPWNEFGRVFSFVTSDTHFAWSLYFPDSTPNIVGAPLSSSRGLKHNAMSLSAPGESMSVHFVLGIGVEEYSASQASQALEDMIDRLGPDQVIEMPPPGAASE